jgi:hypothetical protein
VLSLERRRPSGRESRRACRSSAAPTLGHRRGASLLPCCTRVNSHGVARAQGLNRTGFASRRRAELPNARTVERPLGNKPHVVGFTFGRPYPSRTTTSIFRKTASIARRSIRARGGANALRARAGSRAAQSARCRSRTIRPNFGGCGRARRAGPRARDRAREIVGRQQ